MDEESDPVSSVLDANSDHVIEPSDDERGMRSTLENPKEMIDKWKDEKDAVVELSKTYSYLR